MRWMLSALAMTASMACGGVCPQASPVTGPDGGAVACLIPDTCPRASGLFVCTNVSDLRNDCIACQQNTCQRLSPGACP